MMDFWSLPGGWVDVLETLHSNTVKEVYEEAGLDVKPTFIIAIHDQHKHNYPPLAHRVQKAFIMCERLSGEFKKNSETLESAYFSLDKLPPMNDAKKYESSSRALFSSI